MSVSLDLTAANLGTVQSEQQPFPPTIASATTIAPSSFLTFVSGTISVATITPPIAGQHLLVLSFTNASPGALATTGNIKAAVTTVQWTPLFLVYDPSTALYYAGVPS